jgi:hypothetical protein
VDAFIREVSSEEVNWKKFRSWLAALENMAILVLHDLAPDAVVQLYFGSAVTRHWTQLRPLIVCLRAHYGSSDFLQHVEMLNTFIDEKGFGLSERKRSRLKRQILEKRQKSGQ